MVAKGTQQVQNCQLYREVRWLKRGTAHKGLWPAVDVHGGISVSSLSNPPLHEIVTASCAGHIIHKHAHYAPARRSELC